MLELIIALAVVILDQLSKYFIQIYLSPIGTSYPLWEGVFHLTNVHNTGAAFGMLSGGRWIFIVISSLASAAIIWLFLKHRSRMHILLRISLSLILAGAVGNLIDRALIGYVRDMLEIRLVQFAIFNVADSAVTVGATLLALDVLFGKSRKLLDDLEKETESKRKKKTAAQEQKAEPTAQDQTRPDNETETDFSEDAEHGHGEF